MWIKEIQSHLTDCIIPFWLHLKDCEYGGYYSYVDSDLVTHQTAEKGCILNSRILWFFSNAYELLREAPLLDAATHAYTFLKTYCLDSENGGLYWSVTYDGAVCDATKHTYNQAFAIYALANYYQVSHDQEALTLAYDLFKLIETKCKDSVGYLEAFDRNFHPVENDKLSENGVIAQKTMNTLLHVFEAYTALYDVTQDKEIADCMRWILDVFESKVYNPAKRRQEVFFNDQMQSILDMHSYGHDIETAWLIDLGCKVLGDPSYIKKMRPITTALEKEIYDIAFDGHSLLNEEAHGIVNTDRIWWVQAEAMVGFFNAYEKNPAQTFYLDAVKNLWHYIKSYMLDPRLHSEWFWSLDQNGNPHPQKPIVEPWKCPYHNGRMCFEFIRRSKNVTSKIFH